MPTARGTTVVSQMLEFYGLREHPFGVSPDPRFLYPSFQHREAIASLIFGIESQVGFAALIAEPGAGKTTLLFDLLQRYRDRASTAFIFNTQCSGPELLRQVVLELQVPGADSERDPLRLHQLFTEFVASQLRTKPVVIIIDEAQNLENSALETLRLLSNFEAANRKLLHIILAGQPQLATKLRHPSLTQLLQRITTVSRLERFSRVQMEECIAFRLRVAGFAGSAMFTDEAMAKITAASGGVPREVNRICINAMQLGFALRQKPIGLEAVEEVLSDLTLAKWGPEAEQHIMDVEVPRSSSNSGGGLVGAPLSPRPTPPRELHPDAMPQIVGARPWDTQYSPAATPAAEAGRNPMRPAPESDLRRVLLEAAAHRRRAAELRLIGLRLKENHSAASSQVLYPYKFAMGCVPSPAGGEQDSGENTPLHDGLIHNGRTDAGGGHAHSDGDNKKTGT
jgi:general secretion pathway protein A